MCTSTCLLGFFLDFLVKIPVSLFLGSVCFPESSFLPSPEKTDVTVAPCFAKLHQHQFRRNKSSNGLNTSLSEAMPKQVHRGGNGEVLGEFLDELGQVLFHSLLVSPLPKVDISPHMLGDHRNPQARYYDHLCLAGKHTFQ